MSMPVFSAHRYRIFCLLLKKWRLVNGDGIRRPGRIHLMDCIIVRNVRLMSLRIQVVIIVYKLSGSGATKRTQFVFESSGMRERCSLS